MAIGRILIAALILFETLNLAGVLNFTLDFSWQGLLVTSVGTFLALEIIYFAFRRKGILLPQLPYFLAAVGLCLDALGDVAHFYARAGWYDQFMHIMGGGIVMALAVTFLSNLKEKLPLALILFLALGLVAFLGDLYEIEEYLEDKFYHGRPVRLGTGPDTADDLMWNLIGGISAGIIYYGALRVFLKRPPRQGRP